MTPPTTRRRRRDADTEERRQSDEDYLIAAGWTKSAHSDRWSRDGDMFHPTAMALRMARKAEDEQRMREASE